MHLSHISFYSNVNVKYKISVITTNKLRIIAMDKLILCQVCKNENLVHVHVSFLKIEHAHIVENWYGKNLCDDSVYKIMIHVR